MEKNLKKIRRRQDRLFEGMDLILKVIHDSTNYHHQVYQHLSSLPPLPFAPPSVPRPTKSPSSSTSSPAK
ncbi:hypothetical protein SESBI_31795 [Sesbania bispinosa]|nr:hypothetical protein SESBI_31795 [Sesbania bispinosa]